MTPTDRLPKNGTGRRPWTRPALHRLRTADAAIGTRTTNDDGPGTFTS